MFRADRFRVKLHAVDGQVAVLQPHDRAIRKVGGDFEAVGQGVAVHGQRMIPRRRKRRGQPRKQAFALMFDMAHFTVHNVIGLHHFATKGLTDGLMTKAHPHQRCAGFRRCLRDRKANAGMIGVTGAGREQYPRRVHRHGLLNIQRIIAVHHDICPKTAKIMQQIVGKTVIIVDQQQHVQNFAFGAGDGRLKRGIYCAYMFRVARLRQGAQIRVNGRDMAGIKTRHGPVSETKRGEHIVARGFLNGALWGSVASIGALALLSVASEGPVSPVVTAAAPVTNEAPEPVESKTNQSLGDRVPVTGQQAPKAPAPAPDTLAAVSTETTASAAHPETGGASSLVDPDVDAAEPNIEAQPAETPVETGITASGLETPRAAPSVSVPTEPAEPLTPQVTQEVALSEDPIQPAVPSTPGETPEFGFDSIEPIPAPTVETSISVDPAQPQAPAVPLETQPFGAPALDDVSIEPGDGATDDLRDTARSAPADETPTVSIAPTPPADGASAANITPEPPTVEVPTFNATPAPLIVDVPTVSSTQTPPTEETPTFSAALEPLVIEVPSVNPTPAPPSADAPQNAQLPGVPEEPIQDTSSTLDAPSGTVGNLAPNVTINRLPRLGEEATPDAEVGEELPEEADEAPRAADDLRPVERFAAKYDNAEGKPVMAIILMDEGVDLSRNTIGLPALRSFPYPISFAVDASLPDAKERMNAYRAEGFEVLATVNLPSGALARDAEVSLAVALEAVPEAVGVLEGVAEGVQGSREAAEQVAEILAQTGHGFVMQNNGLNTVQKLAAKAGVPSAVVFRDFDSAGQTPTVIRRFLDQAAFKAGREGGVIMLGRLREDTISALLIWGLQDRAERVALLPVSAALNTQ